MRTRGPLWLKLDFLKILGVYFFYTDDFYISGLTTVQPLCCRIFVKSKVVILIEN